MKDAENEVPVPQAWRPTLRAIVESLGRRDTVLAAGVAAVDPLSVEATQRCLQAVDEYGDVTLIALPEETWNTSVVQWHGDRWGRLVDLWTAQEGRSDLVLEAMSSRTGLSTDRVHSVYVP